MKVICRIARIIEDHVDDPPEQERFWHAAARARFGKLHRLDHRDRWQIEKRIMGSLIRVQEKMSGLVCGVVNPPLTIHG